MVEEFLKVWLEAVKGAKEIVMKYFWQNESLDILEKEKENFDSKHFKSPATIADREAERYIKEYIGKHFPDHGFLGEEEGSDKKNWDYRWIIDPIDGTKAYMRGMDDWAILLALQYKEEMIVGISSMPVVNEVVWASKGMGCFCHGERCQVSSRVLSEAFLSHERLKYFQREWLVEELESLYKQVTYYVGAKTPRWFHYLVQGKVEVIIGPPWMCLYDIAPYVVMVHEAWGKMTTLSWWAVKDDYTSYVASNGVVHEEVLRGVEEEGWKH